MLLGNCTAHELTRRTFCSRALLLIRNPWQIIRWSEIMAEDHFQTSSRQISIFTHLMFASEGIQRETELLRPNMAQMDHREQFADGDCSLGSYWPTSTYLALLKRPSFGKTRRNSKQRSQNCQESALRDKLSTSSGILSRETDSGQFWLLCFEIRAGFGKAGSFQKC